MPLSPKDHAEAVAILRSEIVGALTRRALDRGELRRALVALTEQRWRAPDADHTRTFGVRRLERW
jgi:putative transposase